MRIVKDVVDHRKRAVRIAEIERADADPERPIGRRYLDATLRVHRHRSAIDVRLFGESAQLTRLRVLLEEKHLNASPIIGPESKWKVE